MLMLTVVMSMVRSMFIITAMFLLVLFYAYTGVILFSMVKYGQAVSKFVIYCLFSLILITHSHICIELIAKRIVYVVIELCFLGISR